MIRIVGKVLGVAVVGFLGITGGLLYEIETIPDNAMLWVYPSQETWSPDSWFMDRDFEKQLQDPEHAADMQRWLDDRQPVVYADVKKDGRYAGYATLPVLLEEPGNVRRGSDGSLLMSWLL